MEMKETAAKITGIFKKYKYAILVLLVGIGLMLIPNIKKENDVAVPVSVQEQEDLADLLEEMITHISGVGRAKVMLSISQGVETLYQTDVNKSYGADDGSEHISTVIITDAQKAQVGLIRQINPATYQGAVVVCEGADNPQVRLSVVEAVSKATGLGTNCICVLKMK